MPDDARKRLESIIERLKPNDLLNQARAVILYRGNGDYDFADGEAGENDAVAQWHRASRLAQDLGRLLANDDVTRRAFLPELIANSYAVRAFECGRGLAEGAAGLAEIWVEMTELFGAADTLQRDARVLGGFIHEAKQRDVDFVCSALNAAVENLAIANALPYLQAQTGISEDGITRLQRAIQNGAVEAWAFKNLSGAIIGDVPSEAFGRLLLNIANLIDGVEVAISILQMHFYSDRQAGKTTSSALIDVGRALLCRADFSRKQTRTDYEIGTIIQMCCEGAEGQTLAHEICTQICCEIKASYLSYHHIKYVLDALLKTQPSTVLDQFLTRELAPYNRRLFRSGYGHSGPLDSLDPNILCEWANREPDARYSLLGGDVISMFTRDINENDIALSPLFLELLAHAPDKTAFLGRIGERFQPSGWSGSLADTLTRRKAKIQPLREHVHADVRQWVKDIEPALDEWINNERKRDRGTEEAFE
jgi:hypothetical protein